MTQGRFQPGPATVVKRDDGYYVEVFFPPVGAGQGPVALLSVSVGDQTARSAPAAASSRHGQRA